MNPTLPQEAVKAMPERIYAKVHGASTDVISGQRGLIGGWNEHHRDGQAEYVRADLAILSALEPSAARELALDSALRKMVALYESEYDADVPFKRPDWLVAALSSPDPADAGKVEGNGLPHDVINLVIAAREVWEEADTLSYYHTDEDFSQRVEALDKALEPFGERVPFENEPDALPSAPSEGAE